MGADLVLNILEISNDKEPNWEAARRHLMQQSDDQLSAIAARYPDHDHGEDEDVDDEAGSEDTVVVEPKRRFLKALDSVEFCWNGNSRNAVTHRGAHSVLLMVGGSTVGDPFSEIDDVELLIVSGMAEAAGFITN
jgi:hypothetical protein